MNPNCNSSSSSHNEEEEEVGIVEENQTSKGYLPPIPVMMRNPYIVASVKQYRSESQNEQLQTHIVSESFIPMAPNLVKPPRKRRRPPFSYSSLIAQAILESENERMTLKEIYSWITSRYPSLYSAEDTGWQNTIRHNLSLNRCFKKVSKAEMDGVKGKGGYWTIDPTQMEKFKNGSFARGSSSLLRRKPNHFSPPNTSTNSDTSTSNSTNNNNNNIHLHHQHNNTTIINNKTTSTESRSITPIHNTTLPPTEPCPVMQIHNLLN